ncbi:serine/threonine-protein kinase [Nonomuraea candida]|uniref:serine/threonine-protein kinase n=1 Tax=Nonomuraea candida TaxID=359159 RepID=UPI0006936A2A|nr:serine/threonine-protein kinase [Nonomuraea candida]
MPDIPALIAGRYQLIELIGRGGMAEVWRGFDQRLDTPVAVKLLNPLTGDVAAGERFAREARAAAQIIHRNVVTVLDVGNDARHRYLVMELLTGRSLAGELAARGPLPVGEACALLAQAAAGLAAAHRAGVVHRDIKPANLHLTAGGALKVVDFGLAHLASEAGRLTTVGTIVGTAAYLAPEQIDGSGGEAAGDLYALGCVAYETMCGRPPFTGTPPELIYQHLHHAPEPPRRHRPDLPPALEQLIMSLLAKDPAQRPGGAEHVQRVLLGLAGPPHLRGRHPAPTPPPAPHPPVAAPGRPVAASHDRVAAPHPAVAAPHPAVAAPHPAVAAPHPAVAAAHSPVAAARAGDTALLDAPPPAPAALPLWRRLSFQVAAGVAAIVVVTAIAIAVSPSSGQVAAPPQNGATTAPPTSPRPSASTPASRASAPATPSPSPSSSAKPTRRAVTTPSPTRAARQDSRSWLAALDNAVTAQQRRGGISPDVAAKAHKKIRDAAGKLAEGKVGEARGKLWELGKDLAKARRKGKLADGPLTAFLAGAGFR